VKASPYPYQERTIEQIEAFKGRALLAHEMGLGKTLCSLWWWERHPEFAPGLVVCPASIKYVWEAEAKDNLGISPLVIEGRKPVQTNGEKLVVINYDVLPWHLENLRGRFKTLFVDECHYLKNPTAKRTKAVRKLAKGVRRIVALSGTPLMNKPLEMFPVLQMLKPGVFETGMEFKQNYCESRWTPWGMDYSKPKKTPQLHKLLKATVMVRYLKKDVLPELPAKTEDEYFAAKNDFLGWMKDVNPKKLKSAERAQAMVRLGYLKRLAAKLKARSVVEWANRWLEEYPDEKLILFAWHRRMIEVLKKRVMAKSVVVDGGVTGRKRKEAVDRFQQDEKTRVFVGNIKAAGVGLTLTASSTVAFAELSFVPADHTQAEDRPHRIGQKKNVWIWYLVAANSMEEDLCEVLQTKNEVVQSILDGGVVDDLNVYTQLMAKMLERQNDRKEER
jgi:SWI/SNF-related matrix-associated actin-dependent regulator 1 of chromatin subfamily A